MGRSVRPSIGRLFGRSVGQSVGRLVAESVDRIMSVGGSVGGSVDRLVGRSVVTMLMGCAGKRSGSTKHHHIYSPRALGASIHCKKMNLCFILRI